MLVSTLTLPAHAETGDVVLERGPSHNLVETTRLAPTVKESSLR